MPRSIAPDDCKPDPKMYFKTAKTPRLPIENAESFLKGKKHILRGGAVSGNRIAVTDSLLRRAEKAGGVLIAPLQFGPPPKPRPKRQ